MPSTAERIYVSYYRIDGIGLDEQVRCVESHAREAGGRILRSYRDEEPSVLPERPGLKRALAFARRHGATLLIATLHNLSRDIRFLRSLERSKVDFLACDLPQANAETL